MSSSWCRSFLLTASLWQPASTSQPRATAPITTDFCGIFGCRPSKREILEWWFAKKSRHSGPQGPVNPSRPLVNRRSLALVKLADRWCSEGSAKGRGHSKQLGVKKHQTEYRTMTRKRDKQGSEEIKAIIAQEGDFLRPLVRTVMQEIMEAEMSETVGAQKGERVEGRLGYRNGYYPRGLVTRVGKLELRVPQDRQGRFSTEIFERYQRSEKAMWQGWSPFQLIPFKSRRSA